VPVSAFALFNLSSKSYGIGSTYTVARVRSDDLNGTINKIESKWKSFITAEPFDYNFLDSQFDAQYRAETRLGSLFSLFAGLSIFIACIGLFGLCAYVAERRTKEIGIRKVLGASVPNVVMLISRDFLILTLLAVVLAFPVAWWMMHKWLEDFAYRISLGWIVFAIAGILTIGIAFLTISYQAIRAALMNPVKNLRTE
jgi:putative ABC transport system permease protein